MRLTTDLVYVIVLTVVTSVALVTLGRSDYVRSIVVYCMYALTMCWVALSDDEEDALLQLNVLTPS